VQRALSSPGFPVSEAEMNARAERRTDRAPFDLAGLARQSAALIVAPPRNALLRQVRCPALVLHGADDPVIPAAAARDTAESIPGAKLVIVPGMGHDLPAALVPVCLKHIGDFVAKVEARAV
jgi:proline iminopeptidase